MFCFQRKGAELLSEVRKGFGLEGLGDLQGRIVEDSSGAPTPAGEMEFAQREKYRNAAKNLVLPAFMIKDGREWRLVHYEADILSRLPWGEMDPTPLFELPLSAEENKDIEIRTGLDDGILENAADVTARNLETDGTAQPDYAFAASHLLDVMPNPWRGTELVKNVFDALLRTNDPKGME